MRKHGVKQNINQPSAAGTTLLIPLLPSFNPDQHGKCQEKHLFAALTTKNLTTFPSLLTVNQMRKIILLIFIISLFCLKASEPDKPLWQVASENFLRGILEADYRENPVNELLALKRIPLPHPNLEEVQHPCLLFNASNKNRVISRKHQAPYNEWASGLISAANSNLTDPTSLGITEINRSKIAKLNAFSYVITGNSSCLVKARQAMAHIAPTLPQQTPEGGEMGYGWEDWMNAATALKQYAVAYDLLYHELSSEEIDVITSQLAAQTNQMYRNMTRLPRSFDKTDISTGFGIPKNNHIIDISTAVITVAMVLDHPKAQDWLDKGLDELEGGLALINNDGSYREGYYYGQFAASRLFQLAVYFQNKFGENLLEIPHLNRFTRWLIDLEKPDGTSPLFDDAFNKHYIYQPIGIGLSPQSKELQYLFQRNLTKHSYSKPLFVEAFAIYNNRIRAKDPNFKTLMLYPEGGNAIFRNKIFRNDNSIYGFLLAEPGRPYTTKHDHIEPGAFTLNAFCKNFLIDAGYGSKGVNDKNRSWFTSSRAHNIPLVNGLGPDQNPVWGDDLGGEFSNELSYNELGTVKVKSNYRNSLIERALLFPQQSYFIVIDSLFSDEDKWFSVPWHGRGDLQQTDISSYSWQQDDAILDAEFMSLDRVRFGQSSKLDSYDKSQSNNSLTIHLPESSSTGLVSLFIPKSLESDNIEIHDFPVSSRGKTIAHKIISSNWQDYIVLAKSDWQTDRLRSDASFALLHDGSTSYIYLRSATECYLDEELIFSSDRKINLLIHLEQTGWSGIVDLPDKSELEACSIKFYPALNPGNLLVNNIITDYIWDDGFSAVFTEDAVFRSGKNISNRLTNSGVRENISILQELQYSSDPQRELELMNEADKTCLRNEILDIIARNGIDEVNDLIGKNKFLQHLYGITMGISTSMWDAEEGVAFNIPQSFQLERNILGKQVAYREQGKISNKGISPNYQELIVEDRLRVMLLNDLKKQHELDVEIKQRDYLFYTNWQKYHKLNSFDFELQRNLQNSNWFTNLNFNEMQQSNRQQAGFNKQHYFGRITHFQPWNKDDYNRWFFNGGISTRRFQNRFGFELQNLDGKSNNRSKLVRSASYNQNYKLSAKINLSSDGLFNNFYDEDHLNLNQAVTHSTINNMLRAEIITRTVDTSTTWKVRLNELHTWQSWKLTWQTDLQEKSYSKVTVQKQLNITGYSAGVDSDGILSNTLQHNIFNSTSLHCGQTYDLLNSELKEISSGLYVYSSWQVGNEISLERCDDKWLVSYLAIIGFPVTAYDGFNLSYQTGYWDDGDLDSYEIRLEQYGKNISPGIYISRDDREFLRCEGYISWQF